MAKYSFEIKKKIVSEYLSMNKSSSHLARKYDITVNVNIKMYKKWKIKMYNLGSTIHQLSYHQ